MMSMGKESFEPVNVNQRRYFEQLRVLGDSRKRLDVFKFGLRRTGSGSADSVQSAVPLTDLALSPQTILL